MMMQVVVPEAKRRSVPASRISPLATAVERPAWVTVPVAMTAVPSGDRADEVHLVFQRRVGAPPRQHRHHGAAHAAVEKGAVPAAMDAAHGVHVIEERRAMEDGAAMGDLGQAEVHRARWGPGAACRRQRAA
jgi:hypothetical protein